MLLYAIILLTLLITILAAWRMRGVPLRRSDAYNAMQLAASQSVETDRGVHISLGSAAVRDPSTISAAASAEVAYQMAVRAVPGTKPVILTLSDPVTLGLAQDRLRRAYRFYNRPERYQGTLARWYPQGPLSLAFAAGVGEAIIDGDFSTNVLVGRFGSELVLIAENAARYDRFLVAQSDQVEGQAVAYAVSDAPLIGEELYAGAAYLERTALHVGGVVAQDALRYLVVTVVIAMAILAFLGANV